MSSPKPKPESMASVRASNYCAGDRRLLSDPLFEKIEVEIADVDGEQLIWRAKIEPRIFEIGVNA